MVACLGVSGIASLITLPEIGGWYHGLVRPVIAPPDGVFGPVWTTLYLLMAVAAWRAWATDAFRWRSWCIELFALQLMLNFAWSYLFFGFHMLGAALLDLAALVLAVYATTRAFGQRDPWAGLLMVPYLAWVAFALALNAAFWWLN